ncbi:putative ABC transporter ATP-binding protein [Sphingomonas changbaiensis NBRC 104936]|uniref:Putative ABC transporter ATP-binding protein n=1 Tax=Sphingomonas changbaiensis NBRC 104936 TaxID=1219043 RepID=A0A0E9MP52_9SPHN|nr:ABC-F family ATP-binding cassette domain-containing protein [Sphingomonas changbaiensis]GAO39339.1 putative ABC transporter ATP-binding protein [Sphingomonas changbaiensis NBRC 104936]
MSALLTLDRVSLAAPDGRQLFSDLTLAIGRERVGLVGRNGSGKSTLLRAVAGEIQPIAGTITLGGSIGALWQEVGGSTAADLLGVAPALARLARIEGGAGTEVDFEFADWTLPGRIETALAAIGLGTVDLARPIASFSGGERMRLGLARLMIEAPDLILLDEPTNNLDGEGRDAVARLIEGWRGGALIASHDRELLERVDRIVALSPVGVSQFGGGWSAFADAREAERERAAQALERSEAAARSAAREAQAVRERQARRDSGGRAYAASGSAPRIALGLSKRRAEATAGKGERLSARLIEEAQDALDEARASVERVTPLTMSLPETGLAANRTVLAFDDVVLDRGGRRLFGPLTFTVRGPERIAIAGANGSGKSSLLKLVTGELDPSGGTVQRGVACALLDQHVGLLADNLSLLDNLRRQQRELTANQAHAALARFGFRNRDASRLAGTLSGGERLRAGLACVMSSAAPPQMLLLDEPTNHLDLTSIEALEQALQTYDGALLVVSHDPAFLSAIAAQRAIALP